MTAILGISALYHDAAAALVVDGRVVAAAQEERFSRQKHDRRLPAEAIRYCLRAGGLAPGDLDFVGFYEKPFLKLDRLLETYLAFAPRGYRSFARAMPSWLKRKQFVAREITRALGGRTRNRPVFVEHHESHAASAFFPSPFEEAAILTLDGAGEWATGSLGSGRGNRIRLTHEMRFPHSLGLLYSAFTYFTGFEVNSAEYKLMGLAPYGEPVYADLILEKLMDLKADGSLRLDLSYFDYCHGLTMTSAKLDRLFGGPPRAPEAPITRREMDIAASIQKVTEEVVLRAARHVHALTGARNLCLAGGVALNCVANGRILREGPFDALWIQPAAGDAGGALGTALLVWHQLLGNPRVVEPSDGQRASLLGPEFSDREIEVVLRDAGAAYRRIDDDAALCRHVAREIARGRVVGWFQGRMEYGPRALGSRSILGDARDPGMQSLVNRKVKFREGFRPFAPVVLAEHAHEFFEVAPGQESPYMLLVAPVRETKRVPVPAERAGATGFDKLALDRSVIPAVTHVDWSARIQTVDRGRHGLLRTLLEEFHRETGCPVLVNTSFNLSWEPIVCTPRDAYRTFMASGIDVLCMGHFVLDKAAPAAVALAAGDGAGAPRDEVLGEKLRSPCCAAELDPDAGGLRCRRCDHRFEVAGEIPRLFWPHEAIDGAGDVTEIVKAFYEEHPFPNYDDHDSVRSLIERSRRGRYARRLDESIPYDTDVLEIGCGTGQLANFLGIGGRRVIGTDMCLNSLALGEAFRRRHGLDRVRFVQMNLFRPAFRPEAFDVLLCNGVLHHTADAHGGFRTLLPLLRPGGHVVVGLYNRFGRLLSGLRRRIFGLTGGRGRWLDPILRDPALGRDKRAAWFADQYRHPHESTHTIAEVLAWFDRSGLEFVRGIPALRSEDDGLAGESLFEPQPRGSRLDHLAVELGQVLGSGQREGGFFLMIGRKPARRPGAERRVTAAAVEAAPAV